MAKTIIGTVTSAKGDKTIVVTVTSRQTHPLYGKQYTVSKKFMAHDEKNEAEAGDKVEIIESRPLSARKHHRLNRIIEKPVLREDTLAATKADEPVKKTKVKDEASEAKPVTKSQNEKDEIISDAPKEDSK